MTFTPTLNYNANFNIATSVSDGVAAPVTGSKLMTGTPQNDAPTATNLSQGETYIEDTPLNLVDIVVSDVDSSTATVTLTLSDATAAGALSTATSGLVTSTYNAVTGVWTASGAIADVNTLALWRHVHADAELQRQLQHRDQRQRRRRRPRDGQQAHDGHATERRPDGHEPERRARPTSKTRR